MATRVKVGEVYPDIKLGASGKGSWGQVVVNADKGSDRIIVWFTNPEDIPRGTIAVEIEEIEEANITAKQYNGQWYKTYAVKAKVKAVEGGATPIDITEEYPF